MTEEQFEALKDMIWAIARDAAAQVLNEHGCRECAYAELDYTMSEITHARRTL